MTPERLAILKTMCERGHAKWREKPHEFVFNNGGPVENGFGYCPYCGRTIKEQKVRT